MAKKNGLGKGLDALFIDNNTEDGAITSLKISEIEPNKEQPRTIFSDAALAELADSIREHGVIQPLVVRLLDNGAYQIVAGERRWRAARMAGLTELPVVIRELSDEETLQLALIENLQREDLNLLELAQGYQALIKRYGLTQEQVAAKVGKSRSVVANTIRLIALPDSVQDMIKKGSITFGHARALLALEDEKLIEEAAKRITEDGVLVREIERMGREQKQGAAKVFETPEKEEPRPADNDDDDEKIFYKEMELALTNELGRRVKITSYGKKSIIEMEFYTSHELADIAARLTTVR